MTHGISGPVEHCGATLRAFFFAPANIICPSFAAIPSGANEARSKTLKTIAKTRMEFLP
jgi:hypothetical protein